MLLIFIGKDLHYTILTNSKSIIPLCPTIDEVSKLNNLENLQDSCNLLMTLIQCQKMGRVIPSPLMYKKGDEDAKRPK